MREKNNISNGCGDDFNSNKKNDEGRTIDMIAKLHNIERPHRSATIKHTHRFRFDYVHFMFLSYIP